MILATYAWHYFFSWFSYLRVYFLFCEAFLLI
jgi:hypothetical protein